MEAPAKKSCPEANAGLLELMNLSARLILENGGETYRVEETVRHMGKKEGCTVEIIALPTAIFIMLETPEGQQTATLPLSPGRRAGPAAHVFAEHPQPHGKPGAKSTGSTPFPEGFAAAA